MSVYSCHVHKQTMPHCSSTSQQPSVADGTLSNLPYLPQVRQVDLETGAVLKSAGLPIQFFGEGMTIMRDVMHQITWKVSETLRLHIHRSVMSYKHAIDSLSYVCPNICLCAFRYQHWQGGEGFTYNVTDFTPLSTFQYSTSNGEGWGITHNNSQLIVSDGSANLHFWHPDTHA